MSQRETGVPSKPDLPSEGPSARTLAKAAKVTPISLAAFVHLAAVRHWRILLVLMGFLVQVVLTWSMWQLVDLSLSLMEVWTELARKHLELVLS